MRGGVEREGEKEKKDGGRMKKEKNRSYALSMKNLWTGLNRDQD